MTLPKPLAPETLHTDCDPSQFDFETTADLDRVDLIFGQPRAQASLEFGMRIRSRGYNIFALGSPGVGKLSVVRQLTQQEADRGSAPADWCYVNHFSDPSKPNALRLPAGRGRALQLDMESLIEELGTVIPAAFEGEHYQSQVMALEETLREQQSRAIMELRDYARERRFSFLETPTGFAFAPLTEKGEVISPEQYQKLPEAERQTIDETLKDLQNRLQKTMRQLPIWQKETREKVRALNREIAGFSVGHLIDTLNERYGDLPEVLGYLADVRRDIIEHVEEFLPLAPSPLEMLGRESGDALKRFKVNVIVDNMDRQAAPVIFEDLPNHANLVGRIEHRAHMGTLFSDFTLIKAGALHKANGGYLILDALSVLRYPFAWEALKRALRAEEIRIESLEHSLSLASTTTLEPEPMALDVKIILLGERHLYYLLSQYDPEFNELFRVAADFDETVERDTNSQSHCARVIGSMSAEESLRPLTPAAVARVIDHLARRAGDAYKLSTHIRDISDLVREANYWAEHAAHSVIEREDVQRTLDQQTYRADRIRDLVYEQIERGTMMIDISGEKVGQVNGLSVLQLGDFAFGRPSRITATTRIGEGKVIDIERETELGGAIHSKGVMILTNFLASRYTSNMPLCMTASLVFEQSYSMVDGDSASLAELCAILSSLANLPLRQSLALTGSVNQHGAVQPIGGVNEKIEGFFDICQKVDAETPHGVLVPQTNIRHLMLKKEVVESAKAQRFMVYSVSDVDEAMELLTGVPAGKRDDDGHFPESSVNARVEKRLQTLSEARREFTKVTGETSSQAESKGS